MTVLVELERDIIKQNRNRNDVMRKRFLSPTKTMAVLNRVVLIIKNVTNKKNKNEETKQRGW